VRRDYYAREDWRALRSDPDDNPFAQDDPLIYRMHWTGSLFREMAFIIRVMCQDTHHDLRTAWSAIMAEGVDAATRERALAVLQDLSAVSYERAGREVKQALGSKNKVDEIQLANRLGAAFRAQYQQAAAIAKSGK
jgi:iron(III) transport system substrate-binding protein